MRFDPDIHHRRSIRLREYDYASVGAYFVTICVHGRECLLGEIFNGEMVVNNFGQVVNDEWNRTSELRPQVTLDVFMVMPNHFHGIVVINGDTVGVHGGGVVGGVGAFDVGAYCNTPLRSPSQTVGAIVRGFKSATTKQINQMRDNPGCPVWQRNYYERVIRDERKLETARRYIVENPMKWDLDRENPANMPRPTDIAPP